MQAQLMHYLAQIETGDMSASESLVYTALQSMGGWRTVPEIMQFIGATERNSVAPRVTEMSGHGRWANNPRIKKGDVRQCTVTGRFMHEYAVRE